MSDHLQQLTSQLIGGILGILIAVLGILIWEQVRKLRRRL